MKQRQLGEFTVSAIGLGCMSMSQSYGRAGPGEVERAVHRALELGYTFFDTASVYGRGHNEEFLGRVLGNRRRDVILASKCGITFDAEGRRCVDGSPANIRHTCEVSLRRLNTDVIDLYYLHRRDFNVPIEDSAGTLADLMQEGKIRAAGLSEVSSGTLRRARAVVPVTAVQSEYSLWTRDPENGVLAVCRELGVTFVPFSPLGRAFLTGRIRNVEDQLESDDIRRNMPRFQGDAFEHNLRLLDEYAAIAADNHCTMAQLALAWLLAREAGTLIPIPGTKHVQYVEENAAAVELAIPEADLARAGAIINADTVEGERYPPGHRTPVDSKDDD